MAEFERGLISERTKAGMKAAKARGKHIGRPRLLSTQDIQLAQALLIRNPSKSRNAIAEELGVSLQTLARALKS